MKKNCYLVILVIVAFAFVAVPGSLISQTYVGPEKCLQCHNNAGLGDMTGWRTSMHANGYSSQLDDKFTMQSHTGVVNDYDQNGIDDFHDGLDFNSISSVFDPYKPNAPILAYSADDGYTITIGSATHRMYLTYGGSGLYKQRYAVKINTSEGESKDHYISPIQFNEKTFEYVLYHPEAWYDASNAPIDYTTLALAATNNRSMTKGCSGCHVTALEVEQDGNGEWIQHGAGVENEALYANYNNVYDLDGDGDLDVMNTSCETCHGPGSDHAATTDKTKIINPANLTADQANNLCGMCHSRGKSLPNNTLSYPYDDENLARWSIGDLVADYYTDGGGNWPDGKSSSSHHQHFFDFYESDKPTFQFHNVTCYECHNVHNTEKHHVRQKLVETDSLGADIVVATDNDDNTLCLACHATHGDFEAIPVEWIADYANHIDDIAPIVSAHTNHSYDPTGTGSSRCSKCHMPKIAKSAVKYDIHAHTFHVLSPELTTFYQPEGGMPNSCAVSCHMNDGVPNLGVDLAGDDFGTWNEATDVAMANALMVYYGPGGSWWDTGAPMSVEAFDEEIPATYSLGQNYPNPFNPETKISFDIIDAGFAKLKVYNIIGQEVAVLVNKALGKGHFTLNFDASGLTSGVYIYRLEVNGFVQTKKMLLTK
ncbi:MAG: T9SS C-terminal target domain-containing protein [Calditrichaeota bacterium]|nr:MAG: T9SS C-terminal target domain-containing protein [Calditrichota bacterium]